MPAVPETTANPIAELARRYADVQRLGGGAEGGTFTAREPGGTRVVLKPVDPGHVGAVRHAFTVLRQLASPHLPAPRELWTAADGTSWLVTEWIEGAPLGPGPVSTVEALGDALAVAHALGAIHRAGTHHGDVSLANAIRTPTFGCVLVDLAQLGRLGTGTPGFLAPEVLAGGGGPAADRFALGSLLCARRFGAPPWQRPEALLAVRDRDGVQRRLAELAHGHAVDDALLELLATLLDPNPARRGDDDDALVRRLLHLHAVARAESNGRVVGFAPRWSIPTRWPYRGVDPSDAIAALGGAEPPRLIVVAGPPKSGRTRFVEELVQRLQSDAAAVPARLGDAHALSGGTSWLEAWLSGALPQVLGLRDAAPLVGATLAQQAATLVAAAALAETTVVLPVASELADVLEPSPRVLVVRTRPWTRAELQAALADVIDVDRELWVDAVLAQTGGWSARAVRAVVAAARAGLERPDRGALGEAGDDDELDEALARDVLVAAWTAAPDAMARIPTHLRDASGPWPAVVASARARLGAGLVPLARARLEAERVAGRAPSLALAIAADDAAQVERDIAVVTPALGSADAAAWIEWLDGLAPGRVSSAHLQAAARLVLRDGGPERALELARKAGDEPGARLEAARALQRLGRADAALAELDAATTGRPLDEPTLRALGLRVRVLVDLGRNDEACASIERLQTNAPRRGLGWATLLLWTGFGELARGRRAAAERVLAEAVSALEHTSGVEAEGARARAVQLLGNLAHERGELGLAASRWSEAADAFAQAGEPVGLALLRGSLAALAIPTFATAAGIEHGRAAVRALLARGQLDALATAALNLVQLLARHGLRDEAAALGLTVERALGPWAPASARARALRVAAENHALACTAPSSRRELAERWSTARSAFDLAAHRLSAAGLHAEASEAHARAAACARRAGRLDVASTALAAAQLEATRAGDDDAWRVEAERSSWAAAHRDRGRAAANEPALPERIEAWLRMGQIERAWLSARAAWTVACLRHDRGQPPRRAALAPLMRTIEVIMDKTPNADRAAVRTSLWADAERDALRELADELAGEPVARPVAALPTRAPAGDEGRTERLLRIHRRLAREDRLEPLLEQVIDAVMELTDAERGAIVVREASGVRREVTRELGQQGQGVQFSRSVIDRVLEGGEPVLSVDAAADDRFDGSRSISHLNLRSVLAVALRFRGEVLGAIYVDHRLRRGNFDEDDLAHVEEFAELAALAVAHARALAEVRSQAELLAAQHAQLGARLEAQEVEVAGLRARVADAAPGGDRHGIIGNTPGMERIYKLVDRLADTDVPVVIYGESGTGKELVARAIHRGGSRKDGPFVAENCGAIPETLLESVLFGHARGAFTGADKAKPGLFEAASGGTIFLDEVGETSPAMQTKLLRVLQEGEVRRIGENQARPVDVRVIAASNRDLDALVEQGKFRRDLYYRIHVVRLALPPLRERREDIGVLVQHFLGRHGGTGMRIAPATMRALASHPWPGNVRELENEVQRWVALVDGEVKPEDLSFSIRAAEASVDPDDLRIRPRVDRLERDLIARALERSRNNQTKAAELLGLSRFGLQKKLRKLDAPADAADDEGE